MNTCPHCNTEIDEHEATRCLDAWVALAIFGDSHWEMGSGAELVTIAPEYSNSIAAAWTVVEKLRLAGWVLEFENECAIDCCVALFSADRAFDEDWGTHVARAKAPLAICRAAIKAVEEYNAQV